ncbi:MAG: hypothetical protein JXR48_11855 [Candidatus Delongbacteria bacterium]|nr:hypothetical protein [Candidatus Delongbacteria bacterium]MBN2835646.1 hypothetical protein [Candidatus Delongbacteria bacterium]
MEKKQLYRVFSEKFNRDNWNSILKTVFSINSLLKEPKKILLNSNDKAASAYELGSFKTSDDRIIGLYKIEIKEEI